MDELPDLPFELMLSYLSLADLLKSRAVSRGWKTRIDNHRVKSLCCSKHASGFIRGRSRWISGVFEQNFIGTTRFGIFYNIFGQSILSNLRRLRLCDLELNVKNRKEFTECLQSFSHLEELDMIEFTVDWFSRRPFSFDLSLPMLRSICLEGLSGIDSLTLDAPRLQKVRIDACLERMELVHVESVERVIIDKFSQIAVAHLKNLKQLYINSAFRLGKYPTLLSDLGQLREIYVGKCDIRNPTKFFKQFFKQKQRYSCADLKIYLSGVLLNGAEDPAIDALFSPEFFAHLIENITRLPDEIPFHTHLNYSTIERVAPESATNVLKRYTDLEKIYVHSPIQNVQRFLELLKNLNNIVELTFSDEQSQDLFDRLPEHCAVQELTIRRPPSDFQFLFRLEYLMCLNWNGTFEAEFIRGIFEELEFLSFLGFTRANRSVTISKSFETHCRMVRKRAIMSKIALLSSKFRMFRRIERTEVEFAVRIDGLVHFRKTLPTLNAAINEIESKFQEAVCKNEAAVCSVHLI